MAPGDRLFGNRRLSVMSGSVGTVTSEGRQIIELARPVGAVVPFASTKLKFTRVRRGYDDQLEALLPSLVGGREIYVIQAGDLPRLFPLPLYDRMLLEEVIASDALTPAALRTAALRLDMDGARGSEPRRRAQETSFADHQHEVLTYFAAMERLRGIVTPQMPSWGVEAYDLKAPETHVRINTIVEAGARRFGLKKAAIVARLEELARIVSPAIGLSRSQGHLLALLYEVRHFVGEMGKLRLGGSIEMQEILSYVRLAGRETDKLVTPLFQKVDELFQSVDTFITQTEAAETNLRERVEALGWSLDGWRALTEHWLSGLDHAQLNQATLEQIAPNVPFLPLQLFAKSGRDKIGMLERQRAELVSISQRVAAGEIDSASLDLLRSRRRGGLAGAHG